MDDLLRNVLLVGVALLLALLATPLARRAAWHTRMLSIPRSPERDSHGTPVPLLGGVAIYGAFVLALLLAGDLAYLRELIAIVLGATIMSLCGLSDDRYHLAPAAKLGGQLLAGVVLLVGGVQVQLFAQPWLNWALTLFWVVGITNALNLLDNMDGLSAGIAAIAAAFFVLLAMMNDPRQVLVGSMAAALVGACLGFLRYNFNPASIFMGDTGSLFLGFVLAALAIKLRFLGNTPLVTWLVPLAVLLVPIFDTTLVTVSRLRRGRNPFTTPGKDHLSHRLVALGYTRREAVLLCYVLAFLGGMAGTYLTQATLPEATVLGSALLLAGIAGIVWLERVCPAGVRAG